MRGSIWGVFAGFVLIALAIAVYVAMHGAVMLNGLSGIF